MEQETNILDKIYNVAKAKRLVLNQDEFAQLIGTSRGSLHRYRNGDAIPEELIINAKHVLNRINQSSDKTENVSEPEENYISRRRTSKLFDKNSVTFYEVGAKAGPVGDILPVHQPEGVLHISDLFRGSQFAIRISGNSMMPNYPPGAIISFHKRRCK